MARIAFETIRNASYGTSSCFHPEKRMDQKERNPKSMSCRVPRATRGTGVSESWSPKRSPHPHALWSVAVVLGFLGWVGSALGFIFSASSKDRSNLRPFRRKLIWLSLVLAFAALWFAGMVMA